METRLASLQDTPILAGLHAKSFGEAAWSTTQIADSLALTTTYAVLVEENDRPLGFILCQIVQEEAEILTLCVESALRRKGTGKKLLEIAMIYAQERKARRMFLEVATDNQAALFLYEKAGFCPIGRRKNYYHRGAQKIDALLLEHSFA